MKIEVPYFVQKYQECYIYLMRCSPSIDGSQRYEIKPSTHEASVQNNLSGFMEINDADYCVAGSSGKLVGNGFIVAEDLQEGIDMAVQRIEERRLG